MSWSGRVVAGVAALGLGLVVFGGLPSARGEGSPPGSGSLTEAEAVVLARESGEPVVVSSLTDERTVVTADPVTGELVAELSAGVARVRDGVGGWREPSASLVAGPGGSWVTEAGVVPVRVSAGGGGAFLTLGEGDSALGFVWPGSLPAPVVDGDLATFAEVVPGVDLVVRAAVDGAESFLVVKGPEAARNPLVRSVPIGLVTDGLTAAQGVNGVVSYTDAAGGERFWVPPAYLWDSAGQPEGATVAELLEPGEGARVEGLPAVVAAGSRGGVVFEAGTSVTGMLDDPGTVFPVVIDPSAAGTQSYAVRVTEDFNKYNADIGSRGKLGYNGWTSPYYKSRMYYQFRWPLLDGLPVPGSRINSAEFSYVQTHSPQYDCSNTTFGPAVKVQFYNTISSSTTWSNQPGVHSGSGSKSSDYAVGSESACGKTYTQRWDVSTMVRAERSEFATRTTVTVGLRSADEGDKNGWREYKHASGSSPKLTVVYQLNPSTPGPSTFSPVVSAGVTSSLTPSLTATVALPGGSACIRAQCLVADFEVQGPSGVVALSSAAVASGGTVTVAVPAGRLADLTTYSVRVRARSLDHGGFSAWVSTTMTTRLNVAPPVASAAEVLNQAGSVVSGSPPLVVGSALSLRARMPAGRLCPQEQLQCLVAEFVVKQGTTVKSSWTSGLVAQSDLVTSPVVSMADWVDGSYSLSVRVRKSWVAVWSPEVMLGFNAAIPPARPTVAALRSDPASVSFQIALSPALLGSYTYRWRLVYTPLEAGQQPEVYTGSLVGGARVDVTVVLPVGPTQSGQASIVAWVETPAGVVGPESWPMTMSVFG